METWKSIPTFDGYEISDLGNVRSIDRYVKGPHGSKRFAKSTDLKPSLTPYGYCVVNIGRTPRFIHALVMITFAGDRPHAFDIAHLNGDKQDNRLCNLAYATRSENNRHITDHSRRKLTPEEARAIREKQFNHGEVSAFERDNGLAKGTVHSIKTGRLYAHV